MEASVDPQPPGSRLDADITDVRSGKEHEIEAEHDVCLVFIDAEARAYLSITARAEVRHEPLVDRRYGMARR